MSTNSTGGSYMLDGRLVSGATPNDGDVVTWVAADGCWQPHAPSSIVPAVVNQDYYIDGVSGSDANTGLTKAAPLATIQGFFAKYGVETPIGSQRRVNLAGTGGADPWVTPLTQQTYSVDEINVGTNGPIGNRTVFRGPQNMILGSPTTGPATAALDVALPAQVVDDTGAANPAGQRTELLFTVAAPGWTAHDFSVYGQGYKVRITRAGSKLIFECPIADNTVNSIIVDQIGIVAVLLATDTVEVVFPAARIRGATNYGGGSRLLSIIGDGAGQLALAALTSASMGHNFERLVFEDTAVQGQNISFDRCCFIPGVIASGLSIPGSAHFKNSMAVQCTVGLSYGGTVKSLIPAASNIPRPDGVADPINQVITIEAMFNRLDLGGDGTPGYFTADDNLSCYGSGVSGINLSNQSRFSQSGTCAYLGGDANTRFGIEANDGSLIRVQDGASAATGTATQITGTIDALMVDGDAGAGYGLAAGDFGEVAGYNGNYHITSIAAGVTTGHFSQIHT